MQNRSLNRSERRQDDRQKRSRIYFHESAQPSINRRLDEMEMSFSDYVRRLVQRDIGVYV